jgi:hypothetical protein
MYREISSGSNDTHHDQHIACCSIVIGYLEKFCEQRDNEVRGHYNQHNESLSLHMRGPIVQCAVTVEKGLGLYKVSAKYCWARVDELASLSHLKVERH